MEDIISKKNPILIKIPFIKSVGQLITYEKKKNQFSKSFATIKVYINSVLFKFQTLKTLTNFVFKEFNYFLKRFRMVSYFPYRIWSHCLKLDIETPKSHLQRYLKLEW